MFVVCVSVYAYLYTYLYMYVHGLGYVYTYMHLLCGGSYRGFVCMFIVLLCARESIFVYAHKYTCD